MAASFIHHPHGGLLVAAFCYACCQYFSLYSYCSPATYAPGTPLYRHTFLTSLQVLNYISDSKS
ncbi:hypothetical protein DT73_21200 [Mangrovibacter sp. MFB070]|nr:hypothetical protein DT73_21200 [Mangrovibacter sp. MFB070]